MKSVHRLLILFVIGGSIYTVIEIIYRAIMNRTPTHFSMFILGGVIFILVGSINEYIDWSLPFWMQVLIGTGITVILEFISGCILNLWLNLDIWDYSRVPFNLLGQVCLPFIFLWVFLVAIAIVLDDYLRYWLFGEDRPVYCWKF